MKQRNYILIVGLVLLLMGELASGVVLTTSQFGVFAQNASGYVDGDPIGGGTGYSHIITANDPRITNVSTNAAQFIAALAASTDGSFIYIPETANINLTNNFIVTIPASNITIASNRGESGSVGGRIYQDMLSDYGVAPETFMYMLYAENRNNIRITGLRIEGQYKAAQEIYTTKPIFCGVYLWNPNGFEMDNCELFGWNEAGVYANGGNFNKSEVLTEILSPNATGMGRTRVYIHHNYIHNNQMTGYGYGVQVSLTDVLVKGNVFDYNKHDIADGAYHYSGYEAAYNIDLGHNTAVVFNVHAGANGGSGDYYNIHHNTVLNSLGTNRYMFGDHGIPIIQAVIKNNVFQSCTCQTYVVGYGTCYEPSHSGYTDPVYQWTPTGNMTMSNNLVDGSYVGGADICAYTP